MMSVTTTVGCCDCGQLDDILVACMGDGESYFLDGDSLEGDLPKCRACGADAVVRWTSGTPCPKCGGPVVDTGHVTVMWD